jgi:DNA-binding transcriptional MocR family regulator
VVLVEQPTYFLAAEIFRGHGALVLPAPMHPDGGVDVAELERRLSSGFYPSRPSLLYVIPSHHNPTGFSYSRPHREELCALATKQRLHVVADEVYHFLSWRGARPPRMVACAPGASPFVLSVSSVTKIFSPGARCGWVECADPALRESLEGIGYVQSQGGVAPLVGELVRASMAAGAVQRSLDGLVAEYAGRARLVEEALGGVGGMSVEFPLDGGYFAWVRFELPGGMDIKAFCELLEAADEPVRLLPGNVCRVEGGEEEGEQHARLCFASLDTEELVEGLRRLRAEYIRVKGETGSGIV